MRYIGSIKNKVKEHINLLKFYRQYGDLVADNKTDILGILQETHIMKYLLKYSYVLNSQYGNHQKSEYKDNLWQLWFQGVDQAPKIVKKCMETVQEFSGGREIIQLDENNINNYISIPGYVFDKKKAGYISNVNFSDILRACLLTEHGGTWLDATVMLTGHIPTYILNSSIFCFSTTPKALRGIGNIIASSWFIHSKLNNKLMETTRNLLLEYWKYEKDSRHCYLFHLIFAFAVSIDENCNKEWDMVPFYSNVPPHALQMELFNKYNDARFEQIKNMSFIHKLTFYGGEEYDTRKKNTFYDILINKIE